MNPSARFRPHERMRQPTDFRRAFDRKKPTSDDAMIVYAAENGLNHARLGISIGKKKVRAASARNQIKRLLREVFRLNKQEMPLGIDFVIVPRGPGLTFDHAMRSLPTLACSAARRIGAASTKPAP